MNAVDFDLKRIMSFAEKFDFEGKWEEVDRTFAEWIQGIPDEYKAAVLEVMDQCIINISHFCQKQEKIEEQERKLLIEVRLLNPNIQTIQEMRTLSAHQLEYLAEKYRSRYCVYSLVQGGVSGIGHPLGLVADIPALLILNLNMIQSISGTYGYSLTSPYEQMLALKVLLSGTLSKSYHEAAWNWILDQYHDPDEFAVYVGQNGTIVQQEWLETLAKQLMKGFGLYGLRKVSGKKLSLLGIAAGAAYNYAFTKDVGDFALRFYQYRFREGKQNDEYSGT